MNVLVADPSLACDGGTPLRTTPFPSWPSFDEETVAAASRVLRSGRVNYWTGPEGAQFEKEFSTHVGCRHGVAVANGTLALELALYALGIKSGDDVVVPCRTFVASASSVLMRGARPVFADVDSVSQTVTVETVRAALTPRTRAIIVVHLAGWPVDLAPIMELARRRGCYVIEDCAQAHGARYHGRPVGSLGDVGAFSFCQDKIMTTGGEGGMLVTNDEAVWQRAWSFKDHGKNYEAACRRNHPPGFRWLHEEIGTNWRLTEMQAAIGRVCLGRLPDWVERRREHAALLHKRLGAIPALRVPAPPAGIYHSYYKFYAFLREGLLRRGWDREKVMSAIEAEGVPCSAGACGEVYREKVFAGIGPAALHHPVGAELGRTGLMFLVHPTLRRADIEDTADAVEKVMSAASR
jgi:dTDP-4-amino-4,6-dideoxygalactose transaminase